MTMRFVRLRWIGVAVLLAVSTMAAFADHHVTGKWVIDVKLGDGQGGQATLDLKEEGGKITGTYSGALGSVPVTGTASGDQVEIKLESDAGTVSYKGKVSGDTMEGTCSYGQLGDGTFTGKRSAA
jgi:hypothetical protein